MHQQNHQINLKMPVKVKPLEEAHIHSAEASIRSVAARKGIRSMALYQSTLSTGGLKTIDLISDYPEVGVRDLKGLCHSATQVSASSAGEVVVHVLNSKADCQILCTQHQQFSGHNNASKTPSPEYYLFIEPLKMLSPHTEKIAKDNLFTLPHSTLFQCLWQGRPGEFHLSRNLDSKRSETSHISVMAATLEESASAVTVKFISQALDCDALSFDVFPFARNLILGFAEKLNSKCKVFISVREPIIAGKIIESLNGTGIQALYSPAPNIASALKLLYFCANQKKEHEDCTNLIFSWDFQSFFEIFVL